MQAVRDAHMNAPEQEINVTAHRYSRAIGLQEDNSSQVTLNPSAAKVLHGKSMQLIHFMVHFTHLPCPQIAMDTVLDYKPGRAIPHIRLQIRWGENENLQMKLTGVVSPSPPSFSLEHPKMDTTG